MKGYSLPTNTANAGLFAMELLEILNAATGSSGLVISTINQGYCNLC